MVALCLKFLCGDLIGVCNEHRSGGQPTTQPMRLHNQALEAISGSRLKSLSAIVLIEKMKWKRILCFIGQHLVALLGTLAVITGIPIALVYRQAHQSGYLNSGQDYAELNVFTTSVGIAIIAGMICFICAGIAIGMQLIRTRFSFSRWLPFLLIAIVTTVLFVVMAASTWDAAQTLWRLIWGCVALATYWMLLIGLGYGKREKNQNKTVHTYS